jgi:hypothetical protein
MVKDHKQIISPTPPSGRVAQHSFMAHGLRFGLRAADPVALGRLCAAVPFSWQDAAIGPVDALYSLYVDAPDLGAKYALFCGSELVARAADLELVLAIFTKHAELLTAYHARDRLFVHAGVVGWRGRAIVIPGRSMTGKTTLVKALVEAGAIYYSDEFAVLDAQGQVHPYALPMSIRGTGGQPGQKLPVEVLGRLAAITPLPVGLVVVTQYQEGAQWRPRRVSAGRALLALMDNTVAARRDPDVSMPILRAVTFTATAVRSKRGEAGVAAAALLRWVDRYGEV